MGAALRKQPLTQELPEQPGDVRQTFADITRASTEFGYSPASPFHVGLEQFVTWLREPRGSANGLS